MKYCAKCGNSMEDDMLFCQRCGTKFEGIVSTAENELDVKIKKMKKYNLIIESSSITWQYVNEDAERAGKIIAKQNQMCHELQELIEDILKNADDERRDFAEREVYSFILKMGEKMCLEAANMFADCSGYKELFDQGCNLVRANRLTIEQCLAKMQNVDLVYKMLAGVQGVNAFELKEKLDEEVIYNNSEYRALTKNLAQAFNDMVAKEIKRHTDVFLSPSIDHINMTWTMYLTILEGLPQSIVATLDESGWMAILNDQEKNHNGGQFKRDFLSRRDQQRDAKRREEQEIEDKKYWESHPEEFAEVQKKQDKIVGIREKIQEITKQKDSAEMEMRPFDDKAKNIQREIDEKQTHIGKLEKKIFGKKKAEEEIEEIRSQIEKLENELQEVNEKLEEYQKSIADNKTGIKTLEGEIRNIEQEIEKLRNK